MKLMCRRCLDEGKPAALLGEREPFDNPATFPFSPPCPEHERQIEEALSRKLGRPWRQALAEALEEYVNLVVLCNPDPPRPTPLLWPSQFDAATRLLNLRLCGKRPFFPRRAQQELRKLARRWVQDPAELVARWCEEGVVSAVSQLETPRRIRLGRTWVQNDAGDVGRFRPGDLDVSDGVQWIIAEAGAYARAKALDEPYPRSPQDALTRMEFLNDDRDEVKVQPDDPAWGIEEQGILETLNSVLTPTERRLLTLLIDDTDPARLPALLKCSSATVRVHRRNLREKARQILKVPSV